MTKHTFQFHLRQLFLYGSKRKTKVLTQIYSSNGIVITNCLMIFTELFSNNVMRYIRSSNEKGQFRGGFFQFNGLGFLKFNHYFSRVNRILKLHIHIRIYVK